MNSRSIAGAGEGSEARVPRPRPPARSLVHTRGFNTTRGFHLGSTFRTFSDGRTSRLPKPTRTRRGTPGAIQAGICHWSYRIARAYAAMVMSGSRCAASHSGKRVPGNPATWFAVCASVAPGASMPHRNRVQPLALSPRSYSMTSCSAVRSPPPSQPPAWASSRVRVWQPGETAITIYSSAQPGAIPAGVLPADSRTGLAATRCRCPDMRWCATTATCRSSRDARRLSFTDVGGAHRSDHGDVRIAHRSARRACSNRTSSSTS